MKVLLVLATLLLGWFIYPTVEAIALICWNDEDYSHGLILPVVSAYLLWTDRGRLFALWKRERRGSFSVFALLLMLIGVAAVSAGSITQILYLSWAGVFPLVIGFLGLTLGWRQAAPLLAPVLLLFMAKPIPDSLVPILFFPLQVFAAKVSAQVLELLDVPVYLVGNIIEIPGMRLMVEEACSGIRSLMALLTVACIVMLIVPLGFLSKLFIFFVSVFTAVALNVFRVALTGILAHFYDPSAATGFFHEFSGMVVFGVGLVIVYGLASLLTKKAAAERSELRISLPALAGPGVIGAFLVLLTTVSVQQYPRSEFRKEIRLNLAEYAISLDGWQGQDGDKMELRSRETLKLDQYVRRFYRKEGERAGFLYIGYWGKQSGEYQAAKHSPMMCLPANGFKVTKISPIFIDLPRGERVEVSRVVSQFGERYSLVMYYFFNGPEYYVKEWEALIRIAVNGLLGERTDGGIVEVSLELKPEEARELMRTGALTGSDALTRATLLELDRLLLSGG
jgi:EpsI family protein